jgi:hypothetical protein
MKASYRIAAAIAAALSLIFVAAPAVAQAGAFETNEAIGVTGPAYFRNMMAFTKGRESAGAASSLIVIDNKIHVLTAKHLLGEDMGIEPAVKPTQFGKELKDWLVLDNPALYGGPDKATLTLPVTGIYQPNDNLREDVMVLSTDLPAEPLRKYTLRVAATLPAEKETVYLIGCPYSAKAACGQTIYKGVSAGDLQGYLLITLDSPPDNMSGFSGAPILNSKGEVVAVLRGGEGKRAVVVPLPDWLVKAARK